MNHLRQELVNEYMATAFASRKGNPSHVQCQGLGGENERSQAAPLLPQPLIAMNHG